MPTFRNRRAGLSATAGLSCNALYAATVNEFNCILQYSYSLLQTSIPESHIGVLEFLLHNARTRR